MSNWACWACSFQNTAARTLCEMCGTDRPKSVARPPSTAKPAATQPAQSIDKPASVSAPAVPKPVVIPPSAPVSRQPEAERSSPTSTPTIPDSPMPAVDEGEFLAERQPSSEWPDLAEDATDVLEEDDPHVLAVTAVKRARREQKEAEERADRERLLLEREQQIQRIKSLPDMDYKAEAEQAHRDAMRKIDDQVRAVLAQPASETSWFPKSAAKISPGSALCGGCIAKEVDVKNARCDTPLLCHCNTVIMQWARAGGEHALHLPPIKALASELVRELPRPWSPRNPASLLVEQGKSVHLETLLRWAPELLTPGVLFTAVSKRNLPALTVIKKVRADMFKENEQRFMEWLWAVHDDTSVLQACAAAGHIEFLRDHLVQPLQRVLGRARSEQIINARVNLPLQGSGETITQRAVRYRMLPMLDYLVSIGLDVNASPKLVAIGCAPVQEAARDINTLPALRKLVQLGASLDPIWHLLRVDRKLCWLRTLILDTFFEQGGRCKRSGCFVYKLSSPDLQNLVVSFLWRGLRRPDGARAIQLGERQNSQSKD